MVDMKLSYPRQKELTAAQAGEVFFNVQFVSSGGGSEGVDDGAGFGTLDGVGKQPIFSSDDKGTNGILGAIVIHRGVVVPETATHNIVSYGAGGIRFDFWYRAQAKSPA